MAAGKHGLGRGLNALIGSETKEAAEARRQEKEKGVVSLPVGKIDPDPSQPRQQFDEEKLAELAESLKTYGVIQPLIVRKNKDRYILIAGERRYRAAKMAGLEEVPALIKDYNPQETLEVSLIENIQRRDLNPVEEAKAYKRLVSEYHLKQDEIASRVGKSRAAVANAMRLLSLDDEVLSYVASGELSEGHAKVLLSVSSKPKQRELCQKVLAEGLSVRQLEKLVQGQAQPAKKKSAAPDGKALVYEQESRRLGQILGTKVSIVAGRKKGRIEITYFSEEDLERLLELLAQAH